MKRQPMPTPRRERLCIWDHNPVPGALIVMMLFLMKILASPRALTRTPLWRSVQAWTAAVAAAWVCAAAGASQPAVPSALSLARARITPSALAVCGVDAQGLQALLTAAASPPASFEALAAADDAALQSQVALRAAEEAVWRGGPEEGRGEALAAARSSLATARAAQASAASGARADLTTLAGLSGESAAMLERVAANGARRVPDEYKALDLTAEAWDTLESACVKRDQNDPLSAAESAAITAAEQTAIVITARERLQTSGESLAQAFAAAAQQTP